jgi:hypothetical protein
MATSFHGRRFIEKRNTMQTTGQLAVGAVYFVTMQFRLTISCHLPEKRIGRRTKKARKFQQLVALWCAA